MEHADECRRQRKQLAKEFQNYRKVFIALGDEVRQQIILTLLENETIGMRVPDITNRTRLSRPAVSHHLQILRDAGLIAMHRVGTMNYYYVDAGDTCWSGLKSLVDHVNDVVGTAVQTGYPRLEEGKAP